jgi:hypothetical protein
MRLCSSLGEKKCLKFGNACGLGGIPNECLRHLPRRSLVHLTHLFNRCFRFGHSLAPWKESKSTKLCRILAKTQNLPKNLRPISLLSATGKLFEKLILRTVQKYIEEKNLLNASWFGFLVDHSPTLQCMRLADHISLKFNNIMSTAAAFLDIEKSFEKSCHSGLLHTWSELKLSASH